ncbi:MAG TPA: PEP-utilizing enzyme [Acidimicrobiales bacterium]|nr:PEP-utilizing enzyme [Acidimicrobiales bacterium]
MTETGSDPDRRGLSWTLEDVHYPAPLTRWTAALFVKEETRAISELCREYGLLLDGIEMREIGGRVYTTTVPLGGKVRRPPPAFLVPLLARLVPELRRRIATMRRNEAAEEYRAVVDRWLGGLEEQLLAEGRRLLEWDLDGADEAELASAVLSAFDLAFRGCREHFRLHGVGINEIGRLGLALTKAGWTPAEVTDLFTGLSDTSTGPARAQAEVVARAREAGGLDALAAVTTLDDVRAIGPDVAAALDDYLTRWAVRGLGYEVADPPIVDRPALVLGALRDAARRPPSSASETEHAERRRKAVERAVADLGGGDDARDRVARAQRAFPIREGNETATIGVPVAALHRIGTIVGDRFAADGRLESSADVFDLEPDEVIAQLHHRDDAPADPATLAAGRRAARKAWAEADVPRTIGPPATLPELAGFPADVTEILEATFWYLAHVGAEGLDEPAAAAGATLTGVAAAPGTYEGPARVVLDESGLDRIEPGDVLVCPITSPVWSMVFPSLGALVCDAGGVLSHPAIIAREFGIPAVVGTGSATATVADGQVVRVDGGEGRVELVG